MAMTRRIQPSWIVVLACVALLAGAMPAAAQGSEHPPSLVLDANPGPGDGATGSYLGTIGNTVYYLGQEPAHGAELWRSDGTAAGTQLVKDIFPGSGTSIPTWGTVVGSTLYFAAREPATGVELWRSDGTAAGTVLVKDIRVGTGSGQPSDLVVVGSQIFFRACTAANGCELWKSDGTTAGTVMVKDIRPGTANGLTGLFRRLVVLDGRVLFQANDGVNGAELWVSDGTAAGTVMLKDIDPRPVTGTQGQSNPEKLVQAGGRVFFWANDGVAGRELWKTDGTTSGTVLVKDIVPGAGSSVESFYELIGSGAKVLFFANDPVAGVEL